MTMAEAFAWLNWEAYDFAVGAWETRHSLFARFALYGALLASLVVATSALPGRIRVWILPLASVAGMALLGSLGLALVAASYAVLLYVVVERVPGTTGTLLAWSLLLALAAYPALLPADTLLGNASDMAEFWAFATNVWWLRCVAYVVDRRSRGVARRPLHEVLTATLFFPTFVNGPIASTEQLHAHRLVGPEVRDWADLGAYARRLPACLLRFALGVAKVLLATFYLGLDNETVFGTSGTSFGPLRLWLWAAELYVTFYVVFSGWTDVSIALGRVVGFEVGENFDAPWRARSVGDFWRRWHISFGAWLRSYVYVPLGGNRGHAARNVVLTFLVSALWHVWGAWKVLGLEGYPPAAWTGFLVWGLLNAAGQIAGRQWHRSPVCETARQTLQRRLPFALRDRASQLATFAFVSLAWIPFFLPPWMDPLAFWRIFLRMFYLG